MVYYFLNLLGKKISSQKISSSLLFGLLIIISTIMRDDNLLS